MRLLVSIENASEALVCASVAQHIDYIDVRNLQEGPLQGHYPWMIKAIRESIPAGQKLIATIGGASSGPGTMAQAALGAAVAGADCITVGLSGMATPDQAVELMRGVVRAVNDHNRDSMVVAAGCADARAGKVGPLSLPRIAYEAGADGAMLDTASKDDSGLFDHLPPDACRDFVSDAHKYGLLAVLAGSQAGDVPQLVEIKADIAGVRRAVCSSGPRNGGNLQADLIVSLRQAIDAVDPGCTARSNRRIPDDAANVV